MQGNGVKGASFREPSLYKPEIRFIVFSIGYVVCMPLHVNRSVSMYKRLFSRVSALVALCVLFAASSAVAAPMADFRDLVKAAGPAVVNINTERTEKMRQRPMLPPGFDMFRNQPGFEEFFDNFGGQQQERSQKRASLGSGFVISADGYIVTNNHVVEGADVIRVTFSDKERQKDEEGFKAEVVGTDPETDLALLKIKAENLPFLKFGDSDTLEVGEWLLAIGNPLGLDRTVTAGILSAKSRNIHSGSYDDFLQTDASINPGNSGGPLLNMNGEVVGVNTAIARQAQGIGFAIPSSMAQKIIGDLKDNKRVSRGWIGVTIQKVNAATAKALGLPDSKGALVGDVMAGDPADKGGIKSGDVVLALNGQPIDDNEHLLRKVALLAPGKEAVFTVWREGKKLEKTVLVKERKGTGISGAESDNDMGTGLGFKVRPLEEGEAAKLKVAGAKGLVVTHVAQDSPGATLGMRPGDVVVSVNRTPVATVAEFEALVAAAEKSNGAVLLHIAREGRLFFAAVDLGKKK